jgi:Tfp pilus assembly protein PilN
MRAVNLLPEKHRPRQATGGKGGSSYVLLGILGALVVAVLVYVLTLNSINGAKTDIAEAKAETTKATAEAEALGAYGDFAKVKKEREAAVRQLAQSRVDWERMVRELAHVLPDGVWIQSAEAADSAAALDGADPATAGASGPILTVIGCAVDQQRVADTLVRLRTIQGAEDVKLDHSAQGDEPTSSAGGSSGGSSAASGDCGLTAGKPNYAFQANVTLTAQVPVDKPGTVPARLGGGQ